MIYEISAKKGEDLYLFRANSYHTLRIALIELRVSVREGKSNCPLTVEELTTALDELRKMKHTTLLVTERTEGMWIISEVTQQQVDAIEPGDMIWTGQNTTWWTHREEDVLTREQRGLLEPENLRSFPCGPRGERINILDAAKFFETARQAVRAGKITWDLLLAAHAGNCRKDYQKFEPWSCENWEELAREWKEKQDCAFWPKHTFTDGK